MTIRPLSRDEVRGIAARAARDLGMPTLILMENAGRGAAAWLRDRGVATSARGLILCGPGNNGGGGEPPAAGGLSPWGPGSSGGDWGVVAPPLGRWGSPLRVVWFARADRLRG